MTLLAMPGGNENLFNFTNPLIVLNCWVTLTGLGSYISKI